MSEMLHRNKKQRTGTPVSGKRHTRVPFLFFLVNENNDIENSSLKTLIIEVSALLKVAFADTTRKLISYQRQLFCVKGVCR